MRRLATIILVLVCVQLFGQVVIPNEAQIDPKAELKVYSTDKGVLIPRLSGLDMLAIKDPAMGLWIFNTSNNEFYFFNGTIWQRMQQMPLDPISATLYKGEMFYSDVDKKVKFWNGTAWVTIGTN